MLNYIWSGLIIISIVFALGHDLHDEWNNPYNNGATIETPYSQTQNPESIQLLYNNRSFLAQWKSDKHSHLIIAASENLPEHWTQNRILSENKSLIIQVVSIKPTKQLITFTLPEVHWIKITAIIQAAFDMAKFAVTLALGLAGIMALWLGLMRIAEKSGLIFIFVKLVYPLLRWLFPEIPKHHPALGSISLNLAANVLGLGNAATPLGIKAMQQLQTLNEKKMKPVIVCACSWH